MKWSKRKKELARLRKKHPVLGSAVAFPERRASGGASYPSLTSTGVCKFSSSRGEPLKPPSNILVGTPHKQGPMVMLPDELPWAGGRKP